MSSYELRDEVEEEVIDGEGMREEVESDTSTSEEEGEEEGEGEEDGGDGGDAKVTTRRTSALSGSEDDTAGSAEAGVTAVGAVLLLVEAVDVEETGDDSC
jgi:hypothetical protein